MARTANINIRTEPETKAGAEQLFGKKKSKGYEALLEKVTAIGAVLFIVLSLVIVTME